MKLLWDCSPAAVQAVQEQLSVETLACTTVEAMLNVVHRKRRVKRGLRGKAYFNAPMVSREKAPGHAVSDLGDRLFGGSVEGLVMSLIKESETGFTKDSGIEPPC